MQEPLEITIFNQNDSKFTVQDDEGDIMFLWVPERLEADHYHIELKEKGAHDLYKWLEAYFAARESDS